MQEVINKLNKVQNCMNSLVTVKTSCENAQPIYEEKIKKLDEVITNIAESREYWRKAIDVLYVRSLGELNERLNVAIHYIFHDRDLSVELSLEDKRGKSMQIILKDENGDEISVKDGCGAGIKNAISFILHAYYVNAMGSNILLIDEKYSQISKEYISRFFEFASKLCEATGLSLVLITHDPRLQDLAHKKYNVQNGIVKDVTTNE